MSFPALVPQKTTKNWRLSSDWLRLKGVSLSDILNKTGIIEKFDPKVAFGTDTKSSPAPNPIKIMKFGKHRGQDYNWVKVNDSHYWDWMLDTPEIKEGIPKNLL